MAPFYLPGSREIMTRTFTDSNLDGNYYCVETCERCESPIYVWAAQNVFGRPQDILCSWCKGGCSAAEMDHGNAELEAAWMEQFMRNGTVRD